MTSRQLGCAFAVAWALASVAGSARGQEFPFPPTLHHYRVLPRLSVLQQTGGFAGVNIRYQVRGTFDFEITQTPLAVFPPIYAAEFENAELEGHHPLLDVVKDVDEIFNLDDLLGQQSLRNPRRPNLFHFRGTNDEGLKVDLDAILRGPWLYLRGGTTPPDGSADMFNYHIRAVARRGPVADFNDDGVVDAADLRDWAAAPGRVGGDFLEWQRQLGETAPTLDSLDGELNEALASVGASIAAVPEPSAAALTIAAGAALFARRRRAS